jgi:hypothetical protein
MAKGSLDLDAGHILVGSYQFTWRFRCVLLQLSIYMHAFLFTFVIAFIIITGNLAPIMYCVQTCFQLVLPRPNLQAQRTIARNPESRVE